MDEIIVAVGFGVVTASIFSLGAVGFTLQFGVTNILNLAYGEVMIASAFIASIVTAAGASVWWAFAGATIFGGLFSVALNRGLFTPFIRHGTNLFGMVIVTIAASFIIQNGLQAIFGASFRSLDIGPSPSHEIGPFIFTTRDLTVLAIAVVAMVTIHLILKGTRIGKAMRGTAADVHLARACGIPTTRIIDLGWLLSGMLCGAAGVALVMSVANFTPFTGNAFLVPIVAAAILGGVGHPYGAMVGALIIGIGGEVVSTLMGSAYKDAFPFVLLVAVLLLRPQGIFAEVAEQKEVAA